MACCFHQAFKLKPQNHSCWSSFFCSFYRTGITSWQIAEAAHKNICSLQESSEDLGMDVPQARKCQSWPDPFLLGSSGLGARTQAVPEFVI